MDLEPTGPRNNVDGFWEHDRFHDDDDQDGDDDDDEDDDSMNEVGRRIIRRGGVRLRQTFKRRISRRSSSSSPSHLPSGTKVIVTGLNYDVLDDDLMEIFSEEGEVKYASVRFDRSGRSEGKGDVIFARYSDAERAVANLDNVELNGQIIRVRIARNNPNISPNNPANALISAASAAAASVSARRIRNNNTDNDAGFTITSNQDAGQRRVQLGGKANRRLPTRSSSTGGRRQPQSIPTKEELDDDLDSYQNVSATN